MSGTPSGFLQGPVCPRNYCVTHCSGLLERVFFNGFVCWFLEVKPQLIYSSAGLSRSHCYCKIAVCAPTCTQLFVKQINRKEINE